MKLSQEIAGSHEIAGAIVQDVIGDYRCNAQIVMEECRCVVPIVTGDCICIIQAVTGDCICIVQVVTRGLQVYYSGCHKGNRAFVTRFSRGPLGICMQYLL